ncbi:MAG: crotonase/enoyl-CoA hydratase family protein [Caulobacterales bacterium]
MKDRVSISIENGVADVRMVRADKMNALDPAMFAALVEAGETLRGDRSVRAAVLSGVGRAFCAGLDTESIQNILQGDGSLRTSIVAPSPRSPLGANMLQQAAMIWREIEIPVIAAVHGSAFGGGFQLALGADMRFLTPDVKMAVMEIRWGLVPDMGGIALLRSLVRDDVARDLTYSGRIINGEEAVRLGVATRVCADPLSEALAYANDIAGRNPHAVRGAKRLFNLSAALASQTAILMQESVEQGALIGSPNQKEAIAANLEKRAPKFED